MNFLEKIESDYKAEVVAVQLLELAQDFDKIIIERLGHLPRTYTKDIYNTYEDVSESDLEAYTVFQSFRQSIYEAIPESVFHPPTLGGLGKSAEEIVDEIREQRKKEGDARDFFKPFEQEGPYLEMQALMIELMFEKKHTYPKLYRLFEKNWPVLKKLSREGAMGFIYILPLLSAGRGKKAWAEACLSYLTEMPVSIKEVYMPIELSRKQESFATGKAFLGLNTTLPGAHYDGLPAWQVKVGPLNQENAFRVMPGSGFEELIDELLSYFIPAGILIEKEIDIAGEESAALAPEEPVAARLGLTFTL